MLSRSQSKPSGSASHIQLLFLPFCKLMSDNDLSHRLRRPFHATQSHEMGSLTSKR